MLFIKHVNHLIEKKIMKDTDQDLIKKKILYLIISLLTSNELDYLLLFFKETDIFFSFVFIVKTRIFYLFLLRIFF